MSEPALDCRSCGACCMDGRDGRVPVSAQDLARFRRSGRGDLQQALVPGHFGQLALPAKHNGHCHHLGTPGSDLDCSIYELRPGGCQRVEPGDAQCLSYRRRFLR